jgi:low temperature requirement protein LtrA
VIRSRWRPAVSDQHVEQEHRVTLLELFFDLVLERALT